MITVAIAAAKLPHTTPRRTSGPGRIKPQFFDHHTFSFSHTSFARVHTDMSSLQPLVRARRFSGSEIRHEPLSAPGSRKSTNVWTSVLSQSQVREGRSLKKKASQLRREALVIHSIGRVCPFSVS